MEYHAALSQKYGRAADRPWSTIPPDPPDPIITKLIELGRPLQGIVLPLQQKCFLYGMVTTGHRSRH